MVEQRTSGPSGNRVGKRYRSNRLEGPYDVIVIGSGLGGLSCASTLAKTGKKVVVLEQHYTAGGFTHTYDRNGYAWDPGVHYVGKVGHESKEKEIFDYVTDGKIRWSALDKNYDRVYLGSKQYDFYSGRKEFVNRLKAQFPEEKANIDQYMKRVATVIKRVPLVLFERFLPSMIVGVYSAFLKAVLPAYFYKSTYDVLREITQNETLIGVLTAQWGTFGLPPRSSSFLMHCAIVDHYIGGAYYPAGGSSEIAKAIIPAIQAAGGEVFTYARVESIVVENDRATGVRMADGSQISAPVIVSDAGVMNTFQRLLPDSLVKKAGYEEKLRVVSPSVANISVFVGLQGDAESLNLPNRNIWIYPDEQHDKNVRDFAADQSKTPGMFISFPSSRDPEFSRSHPGRSTMMILSFIPFAAFETWNGTNWGKRGDDYEELKSALSDRLLDALYEKLPQLKGKVDYCETGSPLTTQYYCNYQYGETYGLTHDRTRFGQHWLRPKTNIPGLYLTGQDILSCGVLPAAISGILTAGRVLGWRSWKILKTMRKRSASGRLAGSLGESHDLGDNLIRRR